MFPIRIMWAPVMVGVERTRRNADQLLQALPLLIVLVFDDRAARPGPPGQSDHVVDDSQAPLLDVANGHLLFDRVPVTGPVVLGEGLVDPLGVVEILFLHLVQ